MSPLIVHIGFGVVALVVGPIAMTARKVRGVHTRIGELYHWVVFGVCVSFVVVAALDWDRLWWFLPIAIGSYAFAFLGYWSAKRRWNNWLRYHLTGQGGSYIAMLTAFLVVNWESITGTSGMSSPWAWILPTIIGSPLIAWIQREVALGRRPKLQTPNTLLKRTV